MDFIYNLWKNKKLVWQLGKNDFRNRFASTSLGAIWGFLQPFVFMINNDKDDYNYIERLNEAIENNYNLIACKVYKDEDEFYVNNNKNLFNKLKLTDFLEEVKNHKDIYVVLTDIKDIEEDLSKKMKDKFDNNQKELEEIITVLGIEELSLIFITNFLSRSQVAVSHCKSFHNFLSWLFSRLQNSPHPFSNKAFHNCSFPDSQSYC